MNSASNEWEADPWDASNELADAQLAGFRERAIIPLKWASIRTSGPSIFGLEVQKLIDADVEFYTAHGGEEMLLMRLAWHGFPDPPEWRLATRPSASDERTWASWGYFACLPPAWEMPEAFKI